MNIDGKQPVKNNVKKFENYFDGKKAEIISRASGRVELIGGHTDYNDGFVVASAIDRSFRVAAAGGSDNKIRMYSDWAGESFEFEISKDTPVSKKSGWADYAIGITSLLVRAGVELTGADLLITGDVPVGAGLSSSAALEVAIAKALLTLAGEAKTLDNEQLAMLCQKAENVYAKSPCGIMDQTVVINGRQNHAIMLDCRSLDLEQLPLNSKKCCIMIFNSMVRHEVGGGDYGDRRKQCGKAVEIIKKQNHSVKALRDVDREMLAGFKAELDERLYKRARHIVDENDRVIAAAKALKADDITEFGKLMYQSHCSARDLYEISCVEIDFLVEKIINCPGTFGARLSGGGFGGAAVGLVPPKAAEDVKAKVAAEYKKKFDIDAEIYIAKPSDGIEVRYI